MDTRQNTRQAGIRPGPPACLRAGGRSAWGQVLRCTPDWGHEAPTPGGHWAATGGGWIMLHILVGTAGLAWAIWLLTASLKSKARKWIIASSLGLLGIAADWYFGASFVQADNDAVSFLMSCGLALASLSYSWALWSGERT